MGVKVPDAPCPVLLLPKQCTSLTTNFKVTEDVHIDMTVITRDTDGNLACIYSGRCAIKLTDNIVVNVRLSDNDSDDDSITSANTQVLDNESPVWIDPQRSPNVVNHYGMSESENCYSVSQQSSMRIVVQQQNTFTEFICEETMHYSSPEAPEKQHAVGTLHDDDDYECGMFLSQLPQIINKTQRLAEEEERKLIALQHERSSSRALQQLFSPDMQPLSKQRRTILFLGSDIKNAQTIQQIGFSDPTIECYRGPGINNEVVIDTTEPIRTKKRYQCAKCQQIFHVISDFREHMVKHQISSVQKKSTKFSIGNIDLSFICADCGKRFKTKEKFEKHCRGHGDPDFECHICGKVFSSKASLRSHRTTIHGRKFKCPSCSKTYVKRENMDAHIEQKHSKFFCEHCDFVAITSSELTAHKEVHIISSETESIESLFEGNISSETESIESLFEGNISSETESIESLFEDVICDNNMIDSYRDWNETNPVQDKFDTVQKTYESLRDDFQRDYDNNIIDSKRDWKVENNPAQDKFDTVQKTYETLRDDCHRDYETADCQSNCQVENAEYQRNYKTKRRPRYNMVEKADPPVCNTESTGYKFDNAQEVEKANDVIAQVMSNKMFLSARKEKMRHRKICNVCHKHFNRLSDIKRHLIEHVVHSTLTKTRLGSRPGDFTLHCEVCLKETFNNIFNYKAHLREHANLTLYKCTFCNKSFSDSSNFSKHKKIHNVGSNFQCDLCKRKFNSRRMMERHIQYHNTNDPIPCSDCSKEFYFQTALNKHMKSAHSELPCRDKQYQCKICRKYLKTSKERWDHEWKVHNIRKEIIDCHICDAKFRKYSELKIHFSEKHGLRIKKSILKKQQDKIAEKMLQKPKQSTVEKLKKQKKKRLIVLNY